MVVFCENNEQHFYCLNFRNDSAYETLKEFQRDMDKAKQALLGAIVVTRYNNDKTYRIDDINYRESPMTGVYKGDPNKTYENNSYKFLLIYKSFNEYCVISMFIVYLLCS